MNLSYCSKHRGDIIRGLFFYPPLLFSLHLSSASFVLYWAQFAVTNESLQSTLVANSMLISINSIVSHSQKSKLKSIRRVNNEMCDMHVLRNILLSFSRLNSDYVASYYQSDTIEVQQSVFGIYIWILSVGLRKSQTLLILCK